MFQSYTKVCSSFLARCCCGTVRGGEEERGGAGSRRAVSTLLGVCGSVSLPGTTTAEERALSALLLVRWRGQRARGRPDRGGRPSPRSPLCSGAERESLQQRVDERLTFGTKLAGAKRTGAGAGLGAMKQASESLLHCLLQCCSPLLRDQHIAAPLPLPVATPPTSPRRSRTRSTSTKAEGGP